MRRRADALALGCALGLLLAGCAAPGGWLGSDGTRQPAFARSGLGVPAAAQAIGVGSSTREDVRTALGPAETLRFESGYEVWVYRAKGVRDARASPELVILFTPQGVVKKVRARPAYAAAP
jgi:hypothetical protein